MHKFLLEHSKSKSSIDWDFIQIYKIKQYLYIIKLSYTKPTKEYFNLCSYETILIIKCYNIQTQSINYCPVRANKLPSKAKTHLNTYLQIPFESWHLGCLCRQTIVTNYRTVKTVCLATNKQLSSTNKVIMHK